MLDIRVCDDLDEAKSLWETHWPQNSIFDLWPVRACFQAQFNHRPHFLVAEQNNIVRGMLALSWIDEEHYYGHFPGETWQGKTWIERNRVLAGDAETLDALLGSIPSKAKIRYLLKESLVHDGGATVDEIGYLFFPKEHGYSFETYLHSFSGKSRKKMRAELNRLTAGGVTYRYDSLQDVDELFRLNLESFQEKSYFNDERFLRAFESLTTWLKDNNLLRVTTVLIGGKTAAVDMGAVLGTTYTVLAGGTHPEFAGVAKLINLHHIEWACCQQLEEVDFLCGEFNWKHRFHLTARPLYEIVVTQAQKGCWDDPGPNWKTACAG
jgi:hypothetical protein